MIVVSVPDIPTGDYISIGLLLINGQEVSAEGYERLKVPLNDTYWRWEGYHLVNSDRLSFQPAKGTWGQIAAYMIFNESEQLIDVRMLSLMLTLDDLSTLMFYPGNLPLTVRKLGQRAFAPEGCVCKSDCEDPCFGDCGCKSCAEAYGDFLSAPEP
jgi:hypothetical protein